MFAIHYNQAEGILMAREYTISDKALVALFDRLSGGFPNPEDTSPPGPWGPVIRQALERVHRRFGPRPEPWLEVSLNPQPLPPRVAFVTALAQLVVDRELALQDVSDAAQNSGGERSIIIVGGIIARFVDDYCGNGVPLRWPFPGPRPHWFDKDTDGVDLIVAGVQFNKAAAEISNEGLRRSVADGAAKLVETGVSRLSN